MLSRGTTYVLINGAQIESHGLSVFPSRTRRRFEQPINPPPSFMPRDSRHPSPTIFRSSCAPDQQNCPSDAVPPSRTVRLNDEIPRGRSAIVMHFLFFCPCVLAPNPLR